MNEKVAGSSFKNIIYWILIIFFSIIIASCCISLLTTHDNVDLFPSSIDNVNYHVRNSYSDEDKQNAANYLATIYQKVNTLVNYMKDHNLPNQEVAERLYYRWRKCKLRETSSNDKSVAFTLNKGVEIRICIYDSKTGKFEDMNTCMFVLIHELSHIMSITFGHGEEFSDNFHYLLRESVKLGIYKPEDFSQNPKSYCGTLITSTPCSENACES